MTRLVVLYPTCLVDLYRPRAGIAAAMLLQASGCTVQISGHRCCGRIAVSIGDRSAANTLFQGFVAAHDTETPIVMPSPACASHIQSRAYDPSDTDDAALEIADRTHELHDFLVASGVGAVTSRCAMKACFVPSRFPADSAAQYLLATVEGLQIDPDATVLTGPELSGLVGPEAATLQQAIHSAELLAGIAAAPSLRG